MKPSQLTCDHTVIRQWLLTREVREVMPHLVESVEFMAESVECLTETEVFIRQSFHFVLESLNMSNRGFDERQL